jgi:hypothetical protein
MTEEFFVSEIVHGKCPRGVDSLADQWAKENGYRRTRFPANWDRYGLAAGHRRNIKMAKYGEMLLAVWYGKSHGTRGMIREMTTLGKPVFVMLVEVNHEAEDRRHILRQEEKRTAGGGAFTKRFRVHWE